MSVKKIKVPSNTDEAYGNGLLKCTDAIIFFVKREIDKIKNSPPASGNRKITNGGKLLAYNKVLCKFKSKKENILKRITACLFFFILVSFCKGQVVTTTIHNKIVDEKPDYYSLSGSNNIYDTVKVIMLVCDTSSSFHMMVKTEYIDEYRTNHPG